MARKRCLDAHALKLRDKKKKSGLRKRMYLLPDGQIKLKRTGKTYSAIAPEEFSIYENHEETADFFISILNEIRNKYFHESLYFDFYNVKYVSVESIVLM